MALITLGDGTEIGVTDHDKDLTYNIGTGSLTYTSGTGIQLSDIELTAGFEADTFELSGPIGDTVTREAIMGGRFENAKVQLFEVNHQALSSGAIKVAQGNVSDARVEGGKFVLEVATELSRYNQRVGRGLENMCDADHGDTRCGRTVETVEGTVTAVSSALSFTVSFSGSYANDYFNQGLCEPLTGANVNQRPVEIEDWTSGGVITLFYPFSVAPEVGDTFTLKRGCPKTREACMARDNIANFRGFPEVPGSDQVLRSTIPGQGNEE